MADFVRVCNKNNDIKIEDKYAGVTYKFPPGEWQTVPVLVAEHLFGWGLAEDGREAKFRRMGFAQDPVRGRKRWNNIVFREFLPGENVEPTGKAREAA